MAVEIRAATYASLRTALAAGTYQAGQMVFCEGRASAGDGGQGMFQVKAIGALSDDGGVTLTGGSLAAERVLVGDVSVLWFGADRTGASDSASAIQSALDYADSVRATYVVSAYVSTATPASVYFPPGRYRVETKLAATRFVSLISDGAILYSNALNDYLIEIGGFNNSINGMQFVCTAVGAVYINSTNISSSQIAVRNCRFVSNDAGDECVAVKIENRSAICSFDNCKFSGVGHAFDVLTCDMITVTNSWFEVLSDATYSSDDGYIRLGVNPHTFGTLYESNIIANFSDCMFAGGPNNGNGSATNVAFFKCGSAEHNSSTTASSHELNISKCRIGFEDNAGPILNWFFAARSSNSRKTGFTFRDVDTSPRGANVSALTSTATPIVRLFNLPNRAILSEVRVPDIMLAFAAGTGTDLATLRGSLGVESEVDVGTALFSLNTYSVKRCNANRVYIAGTTDAAEYRQWQWLFGVFTYFFKSDTGSSYTGASGYAIVDTPYKVTELTLNSSHHVWEVRASGDVRVSGGRGMSSVIGYLVAHGDAGGDSYSLEYKTVSGITGGYNGRTLAITPVFWDGLTESATIASSDIADHTIRLKIANSNLVTGTVCRGAYVRPVHAWIGNDYFHGSVVETV